MSLNDLLKSCKAGDNQCTHTRIGDISLNIYPGKYNFGEKETEFYEKIYKDVIVNLKHEFLTEKQRTDGTLVVDFDFRYDTTVTTRQHTATDIEKIVLVFLEEIKSIVHVDQPFCVYVMEKPKVNKLPEKTKDGIHFVFTFDMPRECHKELRKSVVDKLNKDKSIQLPLINSWDDVYDKGISDGTTNWMIFGCRKPSHDVYDITHLYHCELDTADNEFMIIKQKVDPLISFDTFYDLSVRKPKHLIKSKLETKIKRPQQKKTVKSSIELTKTNVVANTDDDKYVDLLFNVIGNGSYITFKEWFQIVGVLKCNGYDFEVLRKYTNIYDYENPKTEKIWDSLDSSKSFALSTLEKLAEQFNPDGYNTWKNINCAFITINDLEDTFKCSEIVSKTLSSKLKLCKEAWFMLDESSQLWYTVKDPLRVVTKEIRMYIDYSNLQTTKKIKETEGAEKEKLIKASETYLAYYKIINGSSYSSSLIRNLKDLLRDNHFDEKLDKNPGKLAFLNGVMDLETKTFRNGLRWDDYLTDTIQYPYEKADIEKTNFVRSVLKKILNNNEEHLEYFLSVIGYSFIGKPDLEKSMYFMIDGTENGKGDNGKTLFFDVLDTLMPYYVKKCSSSFLEEGNTKLHKQLSGTKTIRLLWCDEFSRVKKLYAELMKELANGQTKENEVMYGTTEIIKVLFKMFILSNSVPKIDVEDEAAYNRYKQITFASHFDRKGIRLEDNPDKLEFMADTTLADKLKHDYKNEIYNLVIDYAHKYFLNRLPKIPDKFNTDAENAKKENDKYADWFRDNCCIRTEGKIALQQIKEISGFDEKFIKNGMKRLGYKYLRDLGGLGKDSKDKYYKGGFEGVCLNE